MVVGIIAVLIAILLPALTAARKQAMAIRCGAHLRQLGQAVQIYSTENKGYIPPWRAGYPTATAGTGQAIYDLNGIKYGTPTEVPGESTRDAAYWINFLAKYVSSMKGTGGDAGPAAQAQFQETVIWGCPAWGKLKDRGMHVGAEWEPHFTGYSWNPHPTYSPTHPAPGIRRPPETNRNHGSVGKCGVVSKDNFRSFQNTWWKLKDYSNPSDRALIADSGSWILEAMPVPAHGIVASQKLYYVLSPSNTEYATAPGPSTTGQTTFDWYRHGEVPRVAVAGPGGYFSNVGGKVRYNILYVDGHVAMHNDRIESYKSIRRRYPL